MDKYHNIKANFRHFTCFIPLYLVIIFYIKFEVNLDHRWTMIIADWNISGKYTGNQLLLNYLIIAHYHFQH